MKQIKKHLIVINIYLNSTTKSSLRLPSFSHFQLYHKIQPFLTTQNYHTPTYIQYAFLTDLEKQKSINNYHIVSPTGSGKTLAYMLPIVSSLKKQQEQQQLILTKSCRPRALIIVPIRSQGKQLAHHCKIRCEGINIGKSLNDEYQLLEKGVDILVSTHQRAKSMLERHKMYLSCLKWLIIDQADTLNDSMLLGSILQSFGKSLLHKQNQNIQNPPKLIFVSTTNPPTLKQFIKQNIQNYKTIIDNKTHLNLQNISHQFIHCLELDKHNNIIDILLKNKKQKIMIFCNTVKSLHQLQYYLNSNGISLITLHSQLNKQQRLKNYQLFRDNFQDIMLCTDLGARGLDFINLDIAINYDFPLTVTDYLHRVGRTGRAGRKGKSITLYHKKNIPMIDQLRGASFNQPLKVSTSAYALKNRQQIKKSKYHKK